MWTVNDVLVDIYPFLFRLYTLSCKQEHASVRSKSQSKALLRTNVLNDDTAAPFLVSFLQLTAEKKTPKTLQL